MLQFAHFGILGQDFWWFRTPSALLEKSCLASYQSSLLRGKKAERSSLLPGSCFLLCGNSFKGKVWGCAAVSLTFGIGNVMRAFGVYWWGEEAARVRVTGQSGEELVPFRRLKQWSADITQAPVKARRGFFCFNWLTCQLPWSCSFHLFPRVFERGQPVWWTAWKWWNPQRWNHLFSPVLGEEQKPDFRSEQSHRGHLRGRLPSSASAPWGLLPDEEGFFCAPL